MVSPLSTRLFNLEAKANSVNYPQFMKNNQISRQGWHQMAQAKRVSGYSADKESVQSNSVITSTEKENRAKSIGLTSKKRKNDELHYQAASARSTLTQGGHLHKRSLLGSSRAFPHEGIDTKRAKLIIVSRDNPYEEKTEMVDVYDPSIYSEMVESSKHFYSLVGRRLSNDRNTTIQSHEEGSNATNSTISSQLSDTESDNGTTYEIPPRFEDGYQNVDTNDSERDILKDAINHVPACTTTLEEAFNNQSSPRLITKPEQPYIILHANAAFSYLSGVSSNKLIGHQLNTILKEVTPPSKLSHHPKSKDFVEVLLNNTADSKYLETSGNSSYRSNISKVYSGTRMTHLSIDIDTVISLF
jgi:hypothetical protein